MTVSIEYISGGLFVVQVECVNPEVAAGQKVTLKGPARLLHAWGIMTGAGDSSDTVQIKKNTTAITDAVDLSAKSDGAFFNFGTFDDAAMDFDDGDYVHIDSADDAICTITMLFAERQATP